MTTRKGAPKDGAVTALHAAAPSEGPATPPAQPATPPEQPATPPSDGERSPEGRANDRLELSKDTAGDEVDPATAVFLGSDTPVTRYVLDKPEPLRAGGHLLTERGWVIDPDATPPTGPGVVDPEQVERAEKTVRAETARQSKLADQNKKG